MPIIGLDGQRYPTLPAAINAHLGTPRRRWRDVGGPDSGCGLDYWLQSRTTKLYVNVDQGHLMSCQLLVDDHDHVAS